MACVAIGCSSRMGQKLINNETLSFHRFPKAAQLRDKWVKNINRKDWKPTPFSRLCALHFNEACYRTGYKNKFLHSDAVPTIFSHIPSGSYRTLSRRSKRSRLELNVPTTSTINVQEEILELRGTIKKQMKVMLTLNKIAQRSKIRVVETRRLLKNMRQKCRRQAKINACIVKDNMRMRKLLKKYETGLFTSNTGKSEEEANNYEIIVTYA